MVYSKVLVELKALAANLDHYVEQSDKEASHEYSPYVYTEKDNTFTSLPKSRKNKDIVIGISR